MSAQRGNKRPGAGRPREHGELGRAVRMSASLPEKMIAYLKRRGGGKLSKGVYAVTLEAMEREKRKIKRPAR